MRTCLPSHRLGSGILLASLDSSQCRILSQPIPLLACPAAPAFPSWCAGFTGAFWASYHELLPRQPGFEARADLYELYHKANHYNLCASHCTACYTGLPVAWPLPGPAACRLASNGRQLLVAGCCCNPCLHLGPPLWSRRFGSGYLGDCERLLSRLVKQLK